jgi:hypothetical protein
MCVWVTQRREATLHLAARPNDSLLLGARAVDFAAGEGPPLAEVCGWEGGAKMPFALPIRRLLLCYAALLAHLLYRLCPPLRHPIFVPLQEKTLYGRIAAAPCHDGGETYGLRP